MYFLGNEKNGVTQLKWIRHLKSPHPNGDIDITNTNMNAVWAYHPTSKAIQKHLGNTKGPITINFFTGTTKTGLNLQAVSRKSIRFAILKVVVTLNSSLKGRTELK